MGKVKVYRFRLYDITNDDYHLSRRWGTREGIKAVCGMVLEDTETDIDIGLVGGEVEGLTERDFNPHPRAGFQTKVC
ncbi:hypothetical protein [Rhodopila sp.]|uniref:hypothetical protein n=1 Tax=Rhodopila sp. TaxID=2480087 RepID=UPI003D0D0AB6